jgi:multimeric flavodoxin WrbA
MRILVLGGSPKGDVSVTMQYIEYLKRRFPNQEFQVRQVAHDIKRLVENEPAFDEVIDDVRGADAVLWAFPLYILLVCSQYKRFVELVFERKEIGAFAGKYTASLSTSINFYDITAHNYIRAVSEDLGMKFVGFYSANMNDLRKERERERLTLFANDFFDAASSSRNVPRRYAPLPAGAEVDLASQDRSAPAILEPRGKRITILTDEHGYDLRNRNLRAMTSRLAAAWNGAAKVINLYDIDIRGGCLGCLKCGQSYECAYTGKDGFVDFYRNEVMAADVIVIAGAIVDRQLSWKWRQFFDRSFFNTHTPVLTGKQVAFLVTGPLSHMPDVQHVYEAWIELQEANLVDFITDDGLESPDDVSALYAQIDTLPERMTAYVSAGYVRPRTFLGIAGLKIFRDDIYGQLRIPFPADHKTYKKRGYYDFPTRNPLRRAVIGLISAILRLPFMRKGFVRGMKTGMISRYRSVVESATPASLP